MARCPTLVNVCITCEDGEDCYICTAILGSPLAPLPANFLDSSSAAPTSYELADHAMASINPTRGVPGDREEAATLAAVKEAEGDQTLRRPNEVVMSQQGPADYWATTPSQKTYQQDASGGGVGSSAEQAASSGHLGIFSEAMIRNAMNAGLGAQKGEAAGQEYHLGTLLQLPCPLPILPVQQQHSQPQQKSYTGAAKRSSTSTSRSSSCDGGAGRSSSSGDVSFVTATGSGGGNFCDGSAIACYELAELGLTVVDICRTTMGALQRGSASSPPSIPAAKSSHTTSTAAAAALQLPPLLLPPKLRLQHLSEVCNAATAAIAAATAPPLPPPRGASPLAASSPSDTETEYDSSDEMAFADLGHAVWQKIRSVLHTCRPHITAEHFDDGVMQRLLQLQDQFGEASAVSALHSIETATGLAGVRRMRAFIATRLMDHQQQEVWKQDRRGYALNQLTPDLIAVLDDLAGFHGKGLSWTHFDPKVLDVIREIESPDVVRQCLSRVRAAELSSVRNVPAYLYTLLYRRVKATKQQATAAHYWRQQQQGQRQQQQHRQLPMRQFEEEVQEDGGIGGGFGFGGGQGGCAPPLDPLSPL
ncbi:hypothetical protein PLESTM_000856300 [Pleodorina starrii]|nr:hypothetical protein PLESTM_000856300 [Pleodorina starrii]